MSLVGVVDRGDLYVNEAEQMISLRVIDYKSGAHEFDLGDLYEGLELQLAIYTDVMRELVDQEWNKNRAEAEHYKIVTDSMYYYHMQDPYVQAENETEAEEARERQLTYKGLARDDAEEFDTVLAYAEYKASALVTQMKSGVIDKIRCGSPTRPRAITAHTKMCAGLMKIRKQPLSLHKAQRKGEGTVIGGDA